MKNIFFCLLPLCMISTHVQAQGDRTGGGKTTACETATSGCSFEAQDAQSNTAIGGEGGRTLAAVMLPKPAATDAGVSNSDGLTADESGGVRPFHEDGGGSVGSGVILIAEGDKGSNGLADEHGSERG